ncbi:hypothetical protein BDW59DRAFT_98686 [Aspergillus cavernicola]|uniref:Trypsin-like cysteine/serine peptidase domain-containing protein n=1 Tax=Aspergillus cavernicola TaxID=176166 RepID=A0ABR4I6Y6_9EURO
MSSTLSSAEVMLVSPQQASSPKKRRITPSPESSVSKKLLIISPITQVQPQPLVAPSSFSNGLVANLFPRNGAIIELRRPLCLQHAHPDPRPQLPETPQPDLPVSRQIIFDFDLRTTPSKFLEHDGNKLLLEVFPGAHRVEFDDRVLVYHFKKLPSKPWPKKIAGVPCYLTDNENDFGPSIPIHRRSLSRIAVSDHLNLRDNEAAVDLVFNLVKDFFVDKSISITEIQFWGHVVIIVLEDANEDNLSRVPCSVAQCNCFYLFEQEMCRPRSLSALRRQAISVSGGQIDNSQYEVMRPGVILSSGKHPEEGIEILTSSGVLIKDNFGAKFMTVAAHGFPGPPFDGQVYHPSHAGTRIGEVIMELTHTDISLVKLDEGMEFNNEPFENTIIPAPPFKFAGFSRAAETRIGDHIFLDSPFAGFLEGTKLSHALLRVPSDDPLEPEQTWIRCQWDYMGQGSSEAIVDGICGSPIWGRNHEVIGFFRYAPTSGVFVDCCLVVAADHLLDKGYSML